MQMIVGVWARVKWRLRHLFLPRPETSPDKNVPENLRNIAVAGLLRTGSGIGQSARYCVEGMRATGVSFEAIDLSETFNQVDMDFDNCVLPSEARPWDTLILHLNAPEFERALFELSRSAARKGRSKPRIIGYWAWETPQVPAAWQRVEKYLSEIWVPSAFVADALRATFSVPILIIPHHVPRIAPAHETDFNLVGQLKSQTAGASSFTCLAMADGRSSFDRKNVVGAIEAFKQAFPEDADVRLVLKTRNLGEFPDVKGKLLAAVAQDQRIHIIDCTLSAPQMRDMVRQCDAFISLHRAEGFGLHLAEAMQAGLAVVATGWSGNMEFMSPKNACLARFDLAQIEDSQFVYETPQDVVWAQPDIAHAARLLKQLKSGEIDREALAAQAIIDLENKLGPANYAHVLRV